MKDKVLIILPLMEFLVFEKYKSYLRFSNISCNLITSMLSEEGYSCDFYDLDARAIKKLNHVTDFFKEEKEISISLKNYLKNITDENTKIVETFLDILNDLINIQNYEYVLCSLPCYGNSTNDFLNQVYMAIIYLRHFKNKNKNIKILLGGGWCDRIDLKYWEENIFNLKDIVDMIIIERITKETLCSFLNLGKGKKYSKEFTFCEDIEKNFKIKYRSKTDYINSNSLTMNYVKEENFRNREDLSYTYQEIFNWYGLTIPVKEYSNKVIKQGSFYFSEGCIGSCAFCETGNKKLKLLPFNKITEKIKYYVYDLGYTSLFMKNSAFNPTRSFSDKFCNWLIKENIKITWTDSGRFTETDKDFYSMTYESGCRSLGWGCESYSDRMLGYIDKKDITSEKIKKGVVLSHEAGIWNIMNFIVGMPTETSEDIIANLVFIQTHQEYMDEVHIDPYEVKPNSPFVTNPEKFELFIPEGWRLNVLSPKDNLTSEQSFDYRKKVRDISMSSLMNLKRVHFHVSQILLLSLYDMLGNKENVRKWLLKNFEPYRLSGNRETFRFSKKEDSKDFAPHQY